MKIYIPPFPLTTDDFFLTRLRFLRMHFSWRPHVVAFSTSFCPGFPWKSRTDLTVSTPGGHHSYGRLSFRDFLILQGHWCLYVWIEIPGHDKDCMLGRSICEVASFLPRLQREWTWTPHRRSDGENIITETFTLLNFNFQIASFFHT